MICGNQSTNVSDRLDGPAVIIYGPGFLDNVRKIYLAHKVKSTYY